MALTERGHLSIGEVLGLLKDEFPDVTISKIRFLESQGLIDPERTPSGYRKFYGHDVERLRWILRQQRDQFLPLKVIKDRLVVDESPLDGSVPEAPAPCDVQHHKPDAEVDLEGLAIPDRRRQVEAVNLTLEELVGAAGVTIDDIRQLEGLKMLSGRTVGGTVYYDDEALIVAHLAAAFARFGVDARHLRAYKTAAEREAGTFEALVLPLLKQRNPQARRQAHETLAELTSLGSSLRSAMLRLALRDLTP